jgi:hypothetical protein
MAKRIGRRYAALPLFVLAAVMSAAAQLQVGDNLNMNLNGVLTGGYSDTYGNLISSSHGLNYGGNGVLAGFYHNPNFLSFNMAPYYGQSRQNSDFLSLFKNGGFDASSSIFGGSHFPGSIGFSKNWDTQGNFSLPGLPDFTSRGSGQGFNVGWGAFVPDYPSLNAVFSYGSSNYSVLGSPENGSNDYRRLNLHSAYLVSGFNLNAFGSMGVSHADTPVVVGTPTIDKTSSDDHSFGFSASHRLPLQGSFSAAYNRSYVNSDFLGYRYNGTIDTVNASAGFNPTQKLNFSITTGYSDNLTASLFQTVLPGTSQPLPTGGAVGGVFQNSSQSSDSFFVAGYTYYQLTRELQLQGEAQRRQQSYLGNSYASNLYGGGASYVRGVLGGFLSASFLVAGSNSDYSSGSTVSFSGSLNYSRTFERWVVAGSMTYAQNVQTFLITYQSSSYTYSGSVRRKFFDRVVWTASAAGSHSALVAQPHTGNGSQSYSTSLGVRRVNVNGSYAKSDGYGLLGTAGLTSTGLPPGVIPPAWLIMYGGHSYSFGLGSTPARKLSFGASFSRAWSDTTTGGTPSNNKVEQANAIMNYQLRKLTFTAGYGRLIQGFSASGLPATDVSSFSVGLSRAFNFF